LTVRRSFCLLIALLQVASLANAGQIDARDEAESLDGQSAEMPPGEQTTEAIDLARENYRQILDLASNDPALQVEILRRLADLELDAAEAAQIDADNEALDLSAFDKAVTLYQQVLESYPDYQHNDVVLYQLARAIEFGGRSDDALDVLNQLVDRYPETSIIDEVQFRRGEMLFLRQDFDQSEQAYQDVVNYGERSPFYEQSLYKLGWSQFKLARYEDSQGPLFDLLDRNLGDLSLDDDQPLAGLSRPDQELIRDTIQVLSIGFSYLDGPDSVDDSLAQRGNPEYSQLIYAGLGDLYLEKERFVDAALAYEAFVDRNPTHAAAARMQAEVVDAYERGGFPSQVIESKKTFVERFSADDVQATMAPRDKNEFLDSQLKVNLAEVARYHHAEAQQGGNLRDYREAESYYRQYLEEFPNESDAAGINFVLAEVLFEVEDFAKATEEYERAAYAYPDHTRSAEAGYAALLSYQAHEIFLSGAEKENWHQRYLDSSLKFAESYPDHPEWGAVMTTVAEDFLAQDQFDRAIEGAQAVVAKQPPVDTGLARTAWIVTAHAAFELGNFAMAEDAYYQSRAITDPDDLQGPLNIDERIASSIYRQGEQARDAGDLEIAVTQFRRVKRAVPESSIAEVAEYDAAAALIKLLAWDRAADVLEAFRRDYPDSEYAAEVSQRLAVSYMNAGRGVEAAQEFERISLADTSSEGVRREALWKAADLYNDAGDSSAEQRVLEDTITRYPDPLSESMEARVRLLEILRSRGDQAAVTAALENLVSVESTAGTQRTDRTKYVAGTALLELAEPEMRRFSVVRLTQPLADSVKQKRALMENVINAYMRAAEYGVAEVTTEATFRLAEAFERFSADLRDSERPRDIDIAALEEYELLLEDQVYPFEERAIALYQANTDRSASGIYDAWVRKSFDRLASLMPGRYAKSERSEDVVRTLY
jgi:TolA-binding protein